MELGLGIFGFILMYISDFNQVRWHNPYLKPLFATGALFVVLTTFLVVISNLGEFKLVSEVIVLLIVFLLSLWLLVYTLFFAIPFDESYVSQFHKREAYTSKLYALTRHPGIIPFTIMYIALYMIFKNNEVLYYSVTMIVLNIGYVIYQDVMIFPELFTNYQEYKKTTPFIIPSFKSIKRTLSSYRLGDK